MKDQPQVQFAKEERDEKEQENFKTTFFNPDFFKTRDELETMKKDDLVDLFIEKLSEKGEKKTAFNSKERLEEILNYKPTDIRTDLKEKLNIAEPSRVVGENLYDRNSDGALRILEEEKIIYSHRIKRVFDDEYSSELLTLVLNDGTRISLKPELFEKDGFKFIKIVVANIKMFD